jgi:hypothetical protein
MFLDNSLCFNTGGWNTPSAAITATVDGPVVVDVTGAGVGNAPAMINGFPATNTSIGSDWGAGDGLAFPYFYMTVTTTGTGAGTVTVSISAAPDNGSYSAGTYTQLYASTAFVGTTLVKGSVLLVPLPPTLWTIGEALPRFYKVTYTVSGTVGALKVISGLTINPQIATLGGNYNSNFLAV